MKRLFMLSLFTAVGCSNAGGTAPTNLLSRDVGSVEVSGLFRQEPNSVPAEYSAIATTWRLYGTQRDDVPTAVFADTRTWKTKEVVQGELLARNIRVVALTDEAATLRFSDGREQQVSVGGDVKVREIRHAFDSAVAYRGRGQFTVETATLSQLRVRRGLGGAAERVSLGDVPALKLGALDPEGLLARLGLEEGDLVFNAASLDDATAPLSRGEPVRLEVFRRGSSLTLQYGE